MIKQGHRPTATYRIQLNKDFTFQQLLPVVDYLALLGITHVYLSPVFESVPGSNHGYDTLDFNKISEERGGEAGLKALDEKLRTTEPRMRMILDIVPNHMGASTDNPYWSDVLARGRDSEYWKLFDLRVAENAKIEIPVLGADIGEVLAKGDIKLGTDKNGTPCLKYFDTCFPLSEQSIAGLRDKKDTPPEDVLEAQHYKLVLWSTVKDNVSYRRFFDITGLIGVRVEDPDVYNMTHARLFELKRSMVSIDGVRVDHVDGLVDPAAYLKRLAKDFGHVWIEKILGPDEDLPRDWPVAGTTGYEFIDYLNRLLVDRGDFEAIERKWQSDVGSSWENFHEAVIFGKTLALETLFPAELKRLATLSANDEEGRALAAHFWKGITICLPVYRTYAGELLLSGDDKARIKAASAEAVARFGDDYRKAEARFLPALLEPTTSLQKQAKCEWQQLSGPAMAKGLEDTAHYNYTPLAALNDVGCEADLARSGRDLFFEWMAKRGRQWPATMNATSTHDTKRAEDVRHRLYALADLGEEWFAFFEWARALNKDLESPGAGEEYFLYQAILGTWPLNDKVDDDYVARINQYMLKDIKEAKQKTSWIKPDEAYEEKVGAFVSSLLAHKPFLDAVEAFAKRLSAAGALNSLTVQTLKILSPGMPDFYQGSESWDLSLVDPDNRRPVDYQGHETLLRQAIALEKAEGTGAVMRHLTGHWKDGTVKQWLTRALLRIRGKYIMPMGDITIEPLTVTGKNADRILAYRLKPADGQGRWIAVMLPCKLGRLIDEGEINIPPSIFEGTTVEYGQTLEGARYRDLLNDTDRSPGDIASPAKLFETFPVAVIGCGF